MEYRAPSHTNAFSALRHMSQVALNALLPPQCLGCGELVSEAGVLCPVCWEKVHFLNPPHCNCCGLPFEHDLGTGALCGDCIRQAPLYRRARSAMIYNEHSRNLILSFKHGDRTDATPAFGQWLLRAGKELFPNNDLIVPVPLYWFRLFSRRYNQAALLANDLSGKSNVPVAANLLIRKKHTPSQGKMSFSQRHRNLQGAFKLNARNRQNLKGARVLLIDDVFTTGATVSACARILLQGGADSVDVLTLARVVRTSV